MIETIKIYDGDVYNLINQIDNMCRDFDGTKYGIPPEPIKHKIKVVIYRWVASHQADTQVR